MSRPLEYLNSHARCPDCGSPDFIIGPSGGMAVNIKCAGTDCGHKFWFAPPFEPQRIDNDDVFYFHAPVNLFDEMYGNMLELPEWVAPCNPVRELFASFTSTTDSVWRRFWRSLRG